VTFNDAIDSDHRAVFADVSNTILEDTIKSENKRVRLVGTNSTNEEGERYVWHLHTYLTKIDIFNKVSNLYQSSIDNSITKDEIMRQLNNYDNLLTIAMLKYEKATCSMKDTAYWSPELEQSNLLIQFWNILHKSICQQVDASRRLENICKHLDYAAKLLICETNCPVKTGLR
jgi:hypothetical protein